MADYKLMADGVIKLGNTFIPENELNKDWQDYLAFVQGGGVPDPADQPTAQQIAKDTEINGASLTARQYFAGKQAAIDFIRLTPAEQETQIEGMTLAQLKTVVKYLTVAVAALVKREFLP